MRGIVGAIILAVMAMVCLVISYFQFNEKGFLLNNAYIFVSKQEREAMGKKPHYRQSGVVFLFTGIIFLMVSVDMILQTGWLFYCTMMMAVVAIVYAIISSIAIENSSFRFERLNPTYDGNHRSD